MIPPFPFSQIWGLAASTCCLQGLWRVGGKKLLQEEIGGEGVHGTTGDAVSTGGQAVSWTSIFPVWNTCQEGVDLS